MQEDDAVGLTRNFLWNRFNPVVGIRSRQPTTLERLNRVFDNFLQRMVIPIEPPSVVIPLAVGELQVVGWGMEDQNIGWSIHAETQWNALGAESVIHRHGGRTLADRNANHA